jgi:hypothetical protein
MCIHTGDAMTLQQAKTWARELSKKYHVTIYVHTDPVTGYNLRFISPIEETDHIKGKTVYSYPEVKL